MVHVRRKRGRQVPVLMDKDIINAMDSLVLLRSAVGVNEANIYLFATPSKGSVRPLRGNDCINNLLKKIKDLKYPELIRSTELRKYCATVSPIADLSETDLRWLAEHLSHSLDVHREYYRLRESTVEFTKVLRLLMTIDEGKASEMAGKNLAQISVEGIVSICLLFIEKLQKLSIFHDFREIPINGATEFYEILFLAFMLGITKAI